MSKITPGMVLLAIVCVCLTPAGLSAAAGEPARLMRHPAINNGQIVFSYQNDLWQVPEAGGTARRLTVHVGVEDFPQFSPDGEWIAFSGDYNESRGAVFVMPAGGGVPGQLTYAGSAGSPVGWTPDSKNVVFSSRRESFVWFTSKLFKVPLEGGYPVEYDFGTASLASFSPDGKQIAYNRHPNLFYWWKRYKGSMNHDVWIYTFQSKEYRKVTDYDGNDSWPMWTGDRIYFVSDRSDGVFNIFYYDVAGGNVTQVTSFDRRGVQWPSMSADGSRIVFEQDARLHVLDTGTGQTSEVVVDINSDDRINMITHVDPLKFLRSFDISPNAKRIVFEARGEIYTAPAEHGDVRNLTNSPGARDHGASWSPDGKWIIYVSDRTGDDEVYLVDQMGKEPERKLTSSGQFKTGLTWSPESDEVLFTTNDNALHLLDIDNGKATTIAKNEHRDITSYSWSPDGRWIAYDYAERNRNRDIYIYDTKDKKSHQVTRDLGDDHEPTFTPDGKYLLLVTDRMGGLALLSRISLMPEEEEPFIFEDDEELPDGDEDADEDDEDDEDDDGDKKEKKGKKGKKKDKKVETAIDFDGIEARLRKVPKTIPSPLNIQATERYYYYLILPKRVMFFGPSYDLYALDIEDLESEKVASGITAYGLAANGKKLAYYDGDFHIIGVGKKVAKKTSTTASNSKKSKTKVDIKRRTRMRLDRPAEWNQIFDESWRVVKYHFYDPNLHGVDWDQEKEYYGGLLPHVKSRRELNLLMNEMVGELNASHQGASGGDYGESAPRVGTASLGAKLVLDEKSGFVRFERIYEGDNLSPRNRSPLAADYVKVEEGDYLVAVDGHELEPNENYYKYLKDKTRNKITIATNDKPTMKGATETTFKPLYGDGKLRYLDWLGGSNELVEERGEGKIGYMHLPDMSGTGWREFREKFEKYRYKQALIIDVRFNGGGNIDERIIDYLERRPYHIEKTRNKSAIPRPDDGFYGEVVVLINEYSFSDAEVFPSAVKERGLGTLIGVPTLGFVIAVSSYKLVDGGTIRRTHTGLWEISTGEMMESRGVQPDILVVSPPEMEQAGRDVQLEQAIDYLMGKLAENERKVEYEVEVEER